MIRSGVWKKDVQQRSLHELRPQGGVCFVVTVRGHGLCTGFFFIVLALFFVIFLILSFSHWSFYVDIL